MSVMKYKMNLNYFTEVSVFFNIIPQHPDALFSSLHSFYNCHKLQQHIIILLISIHVSETHSAVVLAYCDQC